MKWKAFFITFGFSKLSQIQEPDPGPKKLSEKLSQTQDLQHLVPWHMLGQERKDAIFSEKKKTRQISGKTYKKMWKIVKILSQFLKGHQYSPISNSLLMTLQLFKISRWCKQLNNKYFVQKNIYTGRPSYLFWHLYWNKGNWDFIKLSV